MGQIKAPIAGKAQSNRCAHGASFSKAIDKIGNAELAHFNKQMLNHELIRGSLAKFTLFKPLTILGTVCPAGPAVMILQNKIIAYGLQCIFTKPPLIRISFEKNFLHSAGGFYRLRGLIIK